MLFNVSQRIYSPPFSTRYSPTRHPASTDFAAPFRTANILKKEHPDEKKYRKQTHHNPHLNVNKHCLFIQLSLTLYTLTEILRPQYFSQKVLFPSQWNVAFVQKPTNRIDFGICQREILSLPFPITLVINNHSPSIIIAPANRNESHFIHFRIPDVRATIFIQIAELHTVFRKRNLLKPPPTNAIECHNTRQETDKQTKDFVFIRDFKQANPTRTQQT